jgi:Protein of unknown function (DUF2589)
MNNENKGEPDSVNNKLLLTDAIAAPLLAALEANWKVSHEQVRYFFEAGFTGGEGTWKVRTIKFLISSQNSQTGSTGGPTDTTKPVMEIEIPLVTLIPLSSMTLESINYLFDFEVTGVDVVEKGIIQSAHVKDSSIINYPHIKGKIASGPSKDTKTKTDEGSNHASIPVYSIEVKSKSLPLPKGMSMVLDALSRHIQVN